MELGYMLFYVGDVKKTMRFYAAAFGLKKRFLHESGQYGEMATGTTKLGFVQYKTASSHGFAYKKVGKVPPACEIGLVTKDVAKAFKKAVKAGAIPLAKPETKPWGQSVSYVKDCNGFLVEICSAIA